MTTTLTGDLLRELAGFRARNGCAFSLYLDLAPSSAATIPAAEARFRAALSAAEKAVERRDDGRDCRLALRNDLARIRAWWAYDFKRDGAHGLVLFASSGDDFFRAIPLAEPVETSFRIGDQLYLAPLVDRWRGDGATVAVVSREQGRIYRLREGRLEEIVDESQEQPGQHEQGGWSQARYRRHIENLVAHHLRTVGDVLDRRLRGGGELVLVLPEELRSEFIEKLSLNARAAIAGYATAESHAGPNELIAAVRPVLDAVDARRHRAALERLEEELGRGGRATAGWDDTLAASADGMVDTLLLSDAGTRPVWQCDECLRACVEDGTCPIDGIALSEGADGDNVAIHHTLNGGGDVLRLNRDALERHDGIAALLRY
ncbi:MAG TPA: Vms1/Ankzf1 family peptidyl-tRNA hydrolase [Gaiellaceae bacterium]|nr:Vms1/Ankzf1 family peptidyl-tRNA hydrolase [Gaiellaceae bacterium]